MVIAPPVIELELAVTEPVSWEAKAWDSSPWAFVQAASVQLWWVLDSMDEEHQHCRSLRLVEQLV